MNKCLITGMKEKQRGEESRASHARLSTHKQPTNKLVRFLWTCSSQGSVAGQLVERARTWKIKHTYAHMHVYAHTQRHLWTAVSWRLSRSEVKQWGWRRTPKSFIGVKTRLSSQIGMCQGKSVRDMPRIWCVFIIHKHPLAPILFTVTANITGHWGIPCLQLCSSQHTEGFNSRKSWKCGQQ